MATIAAEIEQRWARLQELLGEAGLDGLLVGNKHNYWYVSGHLTREIEKQMRPMLFILPASGTPAVVLYAQAEPELARTAPGAACYSYEDVPFDIGPLVEALRDTGLATGLLGCEIGMNERLGLPLEDFRAVQAALPGLRVADCGTILQSARSIKSAYEIDCLRTAARLSIDAWHEALGLLRTGQTNDDVKKVLGAELCRAGSDFDVAGHATVGDGVSGADPYRPGEYLWCDFGATFAGYQADIARRAVFGEVSTDARRLHDAIVTVFDEEVAAIGPGVPASAVARRASDALVRQGHKPLGPRKRVGHGLGLSPSEPPSLGLSDDTVLREGMVLTPEPRLPGPRGEKVHIEDMVVVTADGCELLSDGARTLYSITT